MSLRRLDVYVAVSDMGRATEFYRRFFGAEPVRMTDSYSGFDLNGSLFGLFRQDTYPAEHPLVRGNSTTTNILVEDIDGEFDRVRSLHPPAMFDAVVTTGAVRLFQFADPDHNVIELYSGP